MRGSLVFHSFGALCLPLLATIALAQDDASLLPPGQKLDKKPPAAILEVLKGANTHALGAVAISPDGSRIAWVSRGKHGQRVELTNLRGMGSGRTLSAGKPDQDCNTASPVWSPDGETIAVVSDCGDGKQEQVYTGNAGKGEVKQLGLLKGYVQHVKFAPDGRAITFLYMADATGPEGATSVQRWPEGIIGHDAQDLQQLAEMPLDSGKVKVLTPANLHIYEYDMAPNGLTVFTAAPPPGENNWWVAKIYTQNAGGEPNVIFDPGSTTTPMHGLQVAVPKLSPDGRTIAFIGGLMSDFGSTGGDVWVVPAAGGEARNLTSGMRSTAVWEHWQDDDTLAFSDDERGVSSIRTVALAGGEPKTVMQYDGSFGSGVASMSVSFSKNGRDAAITRSSVTVPPEVWAGPLGNLQQVTHLNSGARQVGGKIESFTWKSGSYDVQGFVTYPFPYDPEKTYPLIVDVHGGPASSVHNRWNGGRNAGTFYSLAGYFVFEPNDRGSFGQGEAFVQANRKEFGYGDLDDALAGVDALEKKFHIDDARVGITGGSYGGFMSMFAPTQTHRFAASVAVAGISDWLSYYGENHIDQWMIPYFGASVYDTPKVYERQSAITFIRQVKTPMLIIVGDRDGECPPPQSFEMWHALRDLGVPTELVVYPNEGHGLSQETHSLDYVARSLDWFAKYMPAK